MISIIVFAVFFLMLALLSAYGASEIQKEQINYVSMFLWMLSGFFSAGVVVMVFLIILGKLAGIW